MNSNKVTVNFENITIEIPEAIADDDQAIKDVLAVYYPGVANSEIVRNESGISIIKKAGKKGAEVRQVLSKLEKVPTYSEPIWAKDLELNLTIEQVEQIDPQLQLQLLSQDRKLVLSIIAALATRPSKVVRFIQ